MSVNPRSDLMTNSFAVRDTRSRANWVVTIVGTSAAMFFAVVAIILSSLPDAHLIDRRSACDRAIEAVMTSHDVVEIERGGVLIKALDLRCGTANWSQWYVQARR